MTFLFVVMEMFENQIVVMVAQLCKYTKNHSAVHLKWVNFVVCKVHCNKAIHYKKKSKLWEHARPGSGRGAWFYISEGGRVQVTTGPRPRPQGVSRDVWRDTCSPRPGGHTPTAHTPCDCSLMCLQGR